MDEARIKLAEAMGWERVNKTQWRDPDGFRHTNFGFRPFTDANDDYAVLEFFQDYQGKDNDDALQRWFDFSVELDRLCHPAYMHEYEVGYYAKAACGVFCIPLPVEDSGS